MSNLATFHDSPISKMSIPKDLADVFESVAAAIFVDSGRLDVVWCSYYLLLRDVLSKLSSKFHISFYSFFPHIVLT